jgi:hypothetical protein
MMRRTALLSAAVAALLLAACSQADAAGGAASAEAAPAAEVVQTSGPAAPAGYAVRPGYWETTTDSGDSEPEVTRDCITPEEARVETFKTSAAAHQQDGCTYARSQFADGRIDIVGSLQQRGRDRLHEHEGQLRRRRLRLRARHEDGHGRRARRADHARQGPPHQRRVPGRGRLNSTESATLTGAGQAGPRIPDRTRAMTKQLTAAIAAAALLSTLAAAPAPAVAQTDGCAVAQPAPKKKGFGGFGKLLGAAQRAGLTDMLAANLGDGAGAQVLGVVAGAAGAAASGGEGGGIGGVGGMGQMMMANALGGSSQGARAAQVAGAVTGMARELGAGQTASAPQAAAAQPCAPAAGRAAPAAAPAAPAAAWN